MWKTFFDEDLQLRLPRTQAGLVLSLLLKHERVDLPMFRDNWIFHYNAVIMALRQRGAIITEHEKPAQNSIGMTVRHTWRVLENKDAVITMLNMQKFWDNRVFASHDPEGVTA